jgi:hypothetical protein
MPDENYHRIIFLECWSYGILSLASRWNSVEKEDLWLYVTELIRIFLEFIILRLVSMDVPSAALMLFCFG